MATNAEKEFYQLSISISKAVNGLEAPLKSKHARSIIITIHKYREAKTFWTILIRQPIMENKFTAWKFCHLLHKVLREAHESALRHSQKHSNMILEVGKSWGHLQDDIGHCIKAYSQLLVMKLNFHDKNRMIPGSLLITFGQIATIAERDVNYYFQLCVEIFDYLEAIIAVQVAVFSSINTYRISSMTQQGQCRLAPIITLIQDSNPLYDISVRLMFKLHEKLPNDVLSGHRERFTVLFNKLKFFYESVRPLQYFHDLISVPQLPERSPDFRSQVDFGSYIPPVVTVQSEPDLVVNDLVDTKSSANTVEQDPVLVQRINTLENVIEEKNETIERLMEKLNTDEINIERMQQSYRQNILDLQNTNTALSNELATTQEMCSNIRMEKDELELKLANNPILIQKVCEEEEKQKLSQEKFNKLKNMYTQIRDEHINLLRQHGEFTKSLNKEKQANAELLMQIKEINEELVKKNESIEETKANESKLLQEIENQRTYTSHLESVAKDNKKEYEDFLQKKENEILEAVNALKEIENELTNVKLILNNKEEKLVEAQSLISIKDTEHADNQKLYEEKYQKLSNTHKELEDVFQKDSQSLRALLDETVQKLKEKENDLQVTETSLATLQQEKIKSEEHLSEMQQKLMGKEADLINTNKKAESLEKETQTLRVLLDETVQKLKEKENVLLKTETSLAALHQSQIKYEELLSEVQNKLVAKEEDLAITIKKVDSLEILNQQYQEKLRTMRNLTIETVREICHSKINNEQQETAEVVSKMTLETDALLQKLNNSAKEPVDECTEKLHDIICLGNYYIQIYDQCNTIYLSTTEIEKGQDILNKVRSLCPDLLNLFEISQQDNKQEEIDSVVSVVQKKLCELNELVQGVLNNFENNVDLEKLIEIELKEMDIAIEDAASKIIDLISKTRENDNKIKLEVNEKILEACTSLMECIKVLIFKSRVLQREIVSSQKGNASTNEFYKRNSQWSDGLISASKSVAKAANYLVEAANNAVNSDSGQNFELIVAAQEIAACTVQLVIASKVKANLNSENLANLTVASKNVTKATGVVVATVKDGNARQEQEQDIEFSKLTPSQLKTMEMEIQVKVLELEQALQTQRFKLSSFRKEHYQKSEY